MHAKDLDELHARYATEEIWIALREHYGFASDVSQLDIFVHCHRSYNGTRSDSVERASIEYQAFRSSKRFPLFVARPLVGSHLKLVAVSPS